MIDLARKVIQLSGKKSISLQFVPMEGSDRTVAREVFNRIPSIEKAKRVLQYQPKVTLDEGLCKVIHKVLQEP